MKAPDGSAATPSGVSGISILALIAREAVSITETNLPSVLVTKAVLPSRDMAIPAGLPPTASAVDDLLRRQVKHADAIAILLGDEGFVSPRRALAKREAERGEGDQRRAANRKTVNCSTRFSSSAHRGRPCRPR